MGNMRFKKTLKEIQAGTYKSNEINLPYCQIDHNDWKKLKKAILKNTNLAKNLEKIDLSRNMLTSISIPKKFTALKVLVLYKSLLKNISLPEELPVLTVLNLSYNKLTKVCFTTKLPLLVKLILDNNELTSISFPKLPALRELYLEHNELVKISISKEFVSLERLHLDNNKLTNVSFPNELPALTVLYLGNNQLRNVSIPKALRALKRLIINDNKLISINIHIELIALKEINLMNNEITSISIPKKIFVKLQNLYFNNNQFTGELSKYMICNQYSKITNNNIKELIDKHIKSIINRKIKKSTIKCLRLFKILLLAQQSSKQNPKKNCSCIDILPPEILMQITISKLKQKIKQRILIEKINLYKIFFMHCHSDLIDKISAIMGIKVYTNSNEEKMFKSTSTWIENFIEKKVEKVGTMIIQVTKNKNVNLVPNNNTELNKQLKETDIKLDEKIIKLAETKWNEINKPKDKKKKLQKP